MNAVDERRPVDEDLDLRQASVGRCRSAGGDQLDDCLDLQLSERPSRVAVALADGGEVGLD